MAGTASSNFTGSAGSDEAGQRFLGPADRSFTIAHTNAGGGLKFSACSTQRSLALSYRLQVGRLPGSTEFKPGSISLSEIGPIKFALKSCAP